jgi:hypothetical protein
MIGCTYRVLGRELWNVHSSHVIGCRVICGLHRFVSVDSSLVHRPLGY